MRSLPTCRHRAWKTTDKKGVVNLAQSWGWGLDPRIWRSRRFDVGPEDIPPNLCCFLEGFEREGGQWFRDHQCTGVDSVTTGMRSVLPPRKSGAVLTLQTQRGWKWWGRPRDRKDWSRWRRVASAVKPVLCLWVVERLRQSNADWF